MVISRKQKEILSNAEAFFKAGARINDISKLVGDKNEISEIEMFVAWDKIAQYLSGKPFDNMFIYFEHLDNLLKFGFSIDELTVILGYVLRGTADFVNRIVNSEKNHKFIKLFLETYPDPDISAEIIKKSFSEMEKILNKFVDSNGKFLPIKYDNRNLELLEKIDLNMTDTDRHLILMACDEVYEKMKNVKTNELLLYKTKKIQLNDIIEECKEKAETKSLNQKNPIDYKTAKSNWYKLSLYVNEKLEIKKNLSFDEEQELLNLLEKLEFSKDKIDYIKRQLDDLNKQREEEILSEKIAEVFYSILSESQIGLYNMARNALLNDSVYLKATQELIKEQLNDIDSIIKSMVTDDANYEDYKELIDLSLMELNDIINNYELMKEAALKLTRKKEQD